jgi:DNA-binding FadR family transcriptional regulator
LVGPDSPSAVEELADNIRTLIADEGLGVGDHLHSERELCERFNTSRNTVREAMRILKAYGVVEVKPKVGAIISDNRMERVFDLFSFNTIEISIKTYEDIQGFRSMIEVDSVERIFCNATAQDVADLREINSGLPDASTVATVVDTDFNFHLRLVSILDNDAICEIYRIMKPVIVRIMEKRKAFADFSSRIYIEHEGVIDALEGRGRIDYQYALQSHLDQGLKTFGISPEKEGWPD